MRKLPLMLSLSLANACTQNGENVEKEGTEITETGGSVELTCDNPLEAPILDSRDELRLCLPRDWIGVVGTSSEEGGPFTVNSLYGIPRPDTHKSLEEGEAVGDMFLYKPESYSPFPSGTGSTCAEGISAQEELDGESLVTGPVFNRELDNGNAAYGYVVQAPAFSDGGYSSPGATGVVICVDSLTTGQQANLSFYQGGNLEKTDLPTEPEELEGLLNDAWGAVKTVTLLEDTAPAADRLPSPQAGTSTDSIRPLKLTAKGLLVD